VGGESGAYLHACATWREMLASPASACAAVCSPGARPRACSSARVRLPCDDRVPCVPTALVGTAAAASASANHILVKDEAKCLELKAAIEASGDVMAKFTELAKEHS